MEGGRVNVDYEKGLKYLSLACEQGQVAPCATLGTGYLLPMYGLQKDVDKATILLKKACDMGSVAGCMNMSRMYKLGDGVARNDALAHKYRSLAAKAKDAQDGGSASGITLGRTS